ncbi:beta-N-acetylhexosaminidase [Treponema primitia ZAS-2]|uniref:beta-N-acetylhexosaminidase n=1 Tax=Treponema primitia (strain ATCC BAA-887 / DSM 12427 / ZAS-2) TaxID=545694 RepID=F5YGV8_TREPZ|nr:glycoside hydrolase family 3 N-terminal domain-containing protein [Treponema primitia]AEF84018.1 beta-N-acetylhexosaminidase [Treponema primitia ZAS-2]
MKPLPLLLLLYTLGTAPLCRALELGAGGGMEGQRRERAAGIAAAMDEKALAAQVLLTGLDGNGSLGTAMTDLLRDISPGGVMLFRMNLNMNKERIPAFLKTVSDLAALNTPLSRGAGNIRIPPFMAVDHEGGQIHRFVAGVERLPSPLSYWEAARTRDRNTVLRAIEEDAARSGRELRSLGITMNLAPVAELLDGENVTFLEDRSYGPDAAFVEEAAAAFIRGMASSGVACVAKHFPGNSGTDPHRAGAVLTEDREALNRRVRPFRGIITRESPAGIMVSHTIVNARQPGIQASRSPAVIQTWLRGELGFSGLVLGDDFSMGAISAAGLTEEAAVVEALIAGVDMVMTWPRSLSRVHRAILRALQEGRLSRERLEEAATRIIYEKICFGLMD